MDLSTSYMGLRLKNPIVPSASPLSQTLDGIRRMEDAGAAAVVMYSLFEEQINLESLSLNDYLDRGTYSTAEALYFIPRNPLIPGAAVEDLYVEILRDVRRSVSVPVALKLSPYFSNVGHVARRLTDEGADALVLFNRFSQPDFDLENLEVEPRLVLSQSHELRLAEH